MAFNASHEHLSFTPSKDHRAQKQQLGVENEMEGGRGRGGSMEGMLLLVMGWHSCVELM